MSAETRKQRELKAREEMILDHARQLLIEQGFQGLNLDQLAARIEYSKGTLYQHFKTKEDLILAIAARSLAKRADLFEKAGTFQGGTRERVCAIIAADRFFSRFHPDYFQVETILKAGSFWEKTSDQQRATLGLHSERCFNTTLRIVQDARQNGDLPKIRESENEDRVVALAIAAVIVGTHLLARCPELRRIAKIENEPQTLLRHAHAMLDGFHWKPFYAEHDWRLTMRRIEKNLFPGLSDFDLVRKTPLRSRQSHASLAHV